MQFDIFGRPQFILDANAQKRNAPRASIEILIFLLVYLIGSTVQSLIVSIPQTLWIMSGERFQLIMEMAKSGTLDFTALYEMVSQLPAWLILVTLFSTAALIAVVLVFCKVIEKRSWRTLGFTKKHAFGEYLLGAVVGFAMFAATYGLCAAFGGVRLNGCVITTAGLPMLLLMLLAFIVQGASEEVLLRGYLTVSLSKNNSLLFSILSSSLIFALLHIANSGFSALAFVNLLLMGVFFAIYMVKRGSLWGACAIHAIWNFVQGNFFGLPVSGTGAGGSVFASEILSEKTLITGGKLGLEASLSVTVTILIAIAVICSVKGRDIPQTAEQPRDEQK